MAYKNTPRLVDLEFDTKAALESLTMFAEKGIKRIQVQELLRQALPRIEDWPQKYAKLQLVCKSHQSCNATEFAAWMDVSRQTYYHWKASGLLVYTGRRVDLAGTLELWTELKQLLRW